ncbi:hypothetical protein OHR68_19580 [Spirillospora sp. NBC_00431]
MTAAPPTPPNRPRLASTTGPGTDTKSDWRWRAVVLVILVGYAAAIAIGLIGTTKVDHPDDVGPAVWVVGAVLGIAVVGSMLIAALSDRGDRLQTDQARRTLQQAEDQLAAGDQLALPALWEITQKRLDYYHQIATSQARHSFRNAQAAMVIGFVLLAVFASFAVTANTTTAATVAGALGAVAAALAGFISRTFVRSQETSASHLRSYFDQPLEFSRYLAAERLLNGAQALDAEQRAAVLSDLLRTVIAPEGSGAGGVASAPSAVTINLSPGASGPASSGSSGGPSA